MLLGAWSLGFGLGNLDGWDGDYTVHLLSAGFFYYNDLNLILLNSHTGELALCFFFLVCLQAGSLQLSPVSVEITYGLERILMLLQVSLESLFSYSIFLPFYPLKFSPTRWQGVDHFKKIQYADGITYGELFLENEYANLLKLLVTSFSTEYFNLEIQ